MQTPDLAGGGWRWRGRGAMGAFGSGGILLMWESTYVWDWPQNLRIPTEKDLFTNMHQSAPDLSFFTSSVGRLAGGEAGRGAWGRGCRDEGSLASFLNKRHNGTDQGAATRESRRWRGMQSKLQTESFQRRHTWRSMHHAQPGSLFGREFGYKTAGTKVSACEWLRSVMTCSISRKHFSQSRASAQAAWESWPVLFQVHRGPFDREEGPRRTRRSRRGGEAGGIQNAAVQHSSPEINNSVWSPAECFWCASAIFF